MSFWTDARVRGALELPAGADARDGTAYTAVSTDSRTLPAGALFVALRGERFDAHDMLGQAAAAGAAAAVVERVPGGAPALVYYVVPDTLVALGLLARAYRRSLSTRVCAITGSNGKTTTKELTRAALATRFRTHATAGNLNNLVGAPLTLLATPPDAEVAVVELGTNAPGEVARLGAVVEPDACIVTGIAEEHLEGLGDLEGVLREETSILLTLPRAGLAVVSDEPPALARRARELRGDGARTLAAGWSEGADPALRAEAVRIGSDGNVAFRWQGREVRLSLPARHNARNALLALGLATEWGVDADAAVAALGQVSAGRMRGEIARFGTLTVLVDCYNSNPSSLRAAVDTLEAMPAAGGRAAVIGTMLELGPRSAVIHGDAARALAESGLDLVVATGEFYRAFEPFAAAMGERLVRVHDPLEAVPVLQSRLRGDEIVLLKGSRGVALERLLPLMEQTWGASLPHGEAERPREGSHRLRDAETRPAGRAPELPSAGGGDDTTRGGD
jgi:UDP-N-acetylmuramoyl-tripeptide--D-alanyl-D-alanine ligase